MKFFSLFITLALLMGVHTTWAAPGDPCATNANCTEERELCDSERGECFAVECVMDAECAIAEVCEQGSCLADLAADRDNDGVPDALDCCALMPNPDQEDLDDDGRCDICDLDDDDDGIPDTTDNCPQLANANQLDLDSNGIGNRCEPAQLIISEVCSSYLSGGSDTDNDGITDACDKCKFLASATNFDSDGDGYGDACDPDKDGDSVRNMEDNCPGMPNQDQADCNCNGMGDACDGLPCDNAFCVSL